MTIENSVSNDVLSTFIDSVNVFDCRLSGVNFHFSSGRGDEVGLKSELSRITC